MSQVERGAANGDYCGGGLRPKPGAAAPAGAGRAAGARARAARDAALVVAAALGVLALFAESRLTEYRAHPLRSEMLEAAGLMRAATEAVAERRAAAGLALDQAADPNGTGLIGLASSGTTTTLGDLAAKRTSVQPDMAALMIALLHEAGARRGGLIAVGTSGSFPGATLATLAAAKAMGLDVALVASLGSSSWGANMPGLSYLAMHAAAEPVLGYGLLGASVGGDGDLGQGMDALDRAALELAIERSGAMAVGGSGLADSVRRRVELYDSYAAGRPIAAFVNIGGAVANAGGPASKAIPPGVNARLEPGTGGVAGAMAARGIPVVQVLDIRGLAASRGLAWDPVPFPEPGRSPVYLQRDAEVYTTRLVALCAGFAASLAALGLAARAVIGRLRRGARQARR